MREKQNIVYWTVVTSGQVNQEELSWLSKSEKKQYDRFRFTKRRDEWLMGRLAAKKLLGSVYPTFNPVRLNEISVLNGETGAPYVLVYDVRVPGVLSISHRQGVACAAWVGDSSLRIGIDLEFIETKSDIFVQDYFTKEESQQVFAYHAEQRALAASLVWSAKEALLKAMQTGLSLDTREVAVSLSSFDCPEDWKGLRVSRCAKHEGFVYAAWRLMGDFVLTCAALGDQKQDQTFLYQQV